MSPSGEKATSSTRARPGAMSVLCGLQVRDVPAARRLHRGGDAVPGEHQLADRDAAGDRRPRIEHVAGTAEHGALGGPSARSAISTSPSDDDVIATTGDRTAAASRRTTRCVVTSTSDLPVVAELHDPPPDGARHAALVELAVDGGERADGLHAPLVGEPHRGAVARRDVAVVGDAQPARRVARDVPQPRVVRPAVEHRRDAHGRVVGRRLLRGQRDVAGRRPDRARVPDAAPGS